jgi:type IV pilus assembly protein PilA
MPRPRSVGFTLIELLIVVVIIGIIAAIAIPKFANTKTKAYVASMKTDLRNLATAQESYYYTNEIYTTNIASLSFTPSSGVVINIPEATAAGWSAEATHPLLIGMSKCALFFGVATAVAPATLEGQIACN